MATVSVKRSIIIIMHCLVFIRPLDQSFKTISISDPENWGAWPKSARVRIRIKNGHLKFSYWKLVFISCVFSLKVKESRPFPKTMEINWNVQHVRLTERGLTFSNNPDGSYQPKKAALGCINSVQACVWEWKCMVITLKQRRIQFKPRHIPSIVRTVSNFDKLFSNCHFLKNKFYCCPRLCRRHANTRRT